MEKNNKEQRITTRYPLDVLKAIRELAKEHERSFNGEVVWLLRLALKCKDKKDG